MSVDWPAAGGQAVLPPAQAGVATLDAFADDDFAIDIISVGNPLQHG